MMKRAFVSVILAIALFSLVFCLVGCRYPVKAADYVGGAAEDLAYLGSGEEFAQPGETEAEMLRRHARIKRIRRQQVLEDIDKVLLLDQPSKLTDKRMR